MQRTSYGDSTSHRDSGESNKRDGGSPKKTYGVRERVNEAKEQSAKALREYREELIKNLEKFPEERDRLQGRDNLLASHFRSLAQDPTNMDTHRSISDVYTFINDNVIQYETQAKTYRMQAESFNTDLERHNTSYGVEESLQPLDTSGKHEVENLELPAWKEKKQSAEALRKRSKELAESSEQLTAEKDSLRNRETTLLAFMERHTQDPNYAILRLSPRQESVILPPDSYSTERSAIRGEVRAIYDDAQRYTTSADTCRTQAISFNDDLTKHSRSYGSENDLDLLNHSEIQTVALLNQDLATNYRDVLRRLERGQW